jgi:hypothetical protein
MATVISITVGIAVITTFIGVMAVLHAVRVNRQKHSQSPSHGQHLPSSQ